MSVFPSFLLALLVAARASAPAPAGPVSLTPAVRDSLTQALVQGRGEPDSPGPSKKVRDKDRVTKAFEKELADLLGLKVEIKRASGESGQLIIKFGNFDQLDYSRQRLGGG